MRKRLLIQELPEPKIELDLDLESEFKEELRQVENGIESLKARIGDIANAALTYALDQVFGQSTCAGFYLTGDNELVVSFHDEGSEPNDEGDDKWERVWPFSDLVDQLCDSQLDSGDDLRKVADHFQQAANRLNAAAAKKSSPL